MRFAQGPSRGPSPERVRVPVFAIGRRVRVACAGGNSGGVTLTDDTGTNALGSLSDGSEVEILAWRPRGAEGTRYRVRATRNALEGWLAVANLAGHPAKLPAAVSGPTPPALESASSLRAAESRDPKRRFGQRSK